MKLCKMGCLSGGDVEHFLFTFYVSALGFMYSGCTLVVEDLKKDRLHTVPLSPLYRLSFPSMI